MSCCVEVNRVRGEAEGEGGGGVSQTSKNIKTSTHNTSTHTTQQNKLIHALSFSDVSSALGGILPGSGSKGAAQIHLRAEETRKSTCPRQGHFHTCSLC